MNEAIRVENVSVHYGEVHALDHVDLTLNSGSVCGLIGMNGSGKSTLFKVIMGMIKPDNGSVRIAGLDAAAARKSGRVGYVPQSEDVDWTFPISVRDVVMMGRYGHLGFLRRPRRADREAVAAALERVELTEFADRQIGQLSGGQKKRASWHAVSRRTRRYCCWTNRSRALTSVPRQRFRRCYESWPPTADRSWSRPTIFTRCRNSATRRYCSCARSWCIPTRTPCFNRKTSPWLSVST